MSRKEEISSFIDYMYPENEVFELCVMQSGPGDISSGYYKDKKAAVQAIMEAESRRPYGIFICANPIKDSSVSGPVDFERIRGGKRSKDKHVSRIRNLVIDVDPVRKSNTSATRKQHKAAASLAREIEATMSKREGWPRPARTDSGNGATLLYKVDLDNSKENVKTIRRCLKALADEFSTKSVKVDIAVGNPGRLTRVTGTKNRKGPDDDPIRPHRRAKLIMLPKNPELLSEKKMRKIAVLRPETSKKRQSQNNGDKTILDVEAYLKAYGVKYFEPKDWHGGKLYPLKACPFDPDDKPGEASIIQDPEGTLYFQCFHRSCKEYRWSDCRRKISRKDKLDRFLIMKKTSNKQQPISFARADHVFKYTLDEPPLINGMLERHGILLIRGAAGIGKSMLALNMALNISNPPGDKQLWKQFLINEKVKVLIVQSENSRNSLHKRLSKMTCKNPRYKKAMRGVYFAKRKDAYTVSGNLQDEMNFMKGIKRGIVQRDIGLVIFDPLITYHEKDENDNRGMRQVLQSITDLCETFKIAAIVIHHDGKSASSRSKGGRGASSIGDWAPNIISLSHIKGDASDIMKVRHVKGRDTGLFKAFKLHRTEDFDFERISGSVKEGEERKADSKNKKVKAVEDEILKLLKEGEADQKTITEQICQTFKKENVSRDKARRVAERMADDGKILFKKEGKRKVYYIGKSKATLSKGRVADIRDWLERRKSVAKNNP